MFYMILNNCKCIIFYVNFRIWKETTQGYGWVYIYYY